MTARSDETFHLHFVTGYQGSGKTYMVDQLLEHGFCAMDFDDVIEDIIEISNQEELPVSWIKSQVRDTVVNRIKAFRLDRALQHNMNHLVIGGLFDFAAENSYADFYNLLQTHLMLVVEQKIQCHYWFIDVPYHVTLRNLINREFTRDDHEDNIVCRQLLATGTAEQAVRHTVTRLLDVLEEHEDMRLIAENTPECRILPAHEIVLGLQETCVPVPGVVWDSEEDLLDDMIEQFAQQRVSSPAPTVKKGTKAKKSRAGDN